MLRQSAGRSPTDYQCPLCNETIPLESGSYSFVRSSILVHLDRCDVSGRMSSAQRSAEATKDADAKFFVSRAIRSRGDVDSRVSDRR